MTTRVRAENEVFLNDTFFPIVGEVRSSIASVYPQKRITGDFDKDSHRNVSIFTWNDQRGGMGVDRMTLQQGDRSLSTGWDIRHKGHLTVGPKQTQFQAGTSGIPIISQIGPDLVAAHGTDIQSWNTSWTSRLTASATPVDVVNGNIGGTEYTIFPFTSGYAWGTAAATWTNRTSQNVVNMAFHDERLWGIDATGQLWYTFTVGSAEVNDAQVLLRHNEVVTGLFEARAPNQALILYAVTSRGLYAHDIGNRKFVRITGVELPDNNAFAHERSAVVWRERIYLAAGRGIIEYDPVVATIREVGFDLDDGLEVTKDGFVSCLAAGYNELFAGTVPIKSGTDAPVVMGWDGLGWRKIYEDAVNTQIESLHIGDKNVTAVTFDALYRANNDIVGFVALNNSSTLTSHINGWQYGGLGTALEHRFSWFDAGQADVTKIILRLKLEVEGASNNTSLKVLFAINDGSDTAIDDTYTNDSTFDAVDDRIEEDGITTFFFPSVASPAGTEFRSIQITLRQDQSAVSGSVDVLSVTLEYIKLLDEKLAFEFEIDFSQNHDGKSPEQLRASYATAQALKTLPEFTYKDDTGGTRNYYVKVLGGQGDEMTGHEERGTQLVRCEQP